MSALSAHQPNLPFRRLMLGMSCLAAITLAGCASLPPGAGPVATSVELPHTWSTTVQGQAPAAAAWWSDFGSSELDGLIQAALELNRDLKTATARLAQARALTSGVEAERRPTLGATAGAQRGRDSSDQARIERSSIGLRASWEVDLLGRGALAVSATEADEQSIAQALSAARIALAADVATAYFELRTLDSRVQVGRDAMTLAQRQLDVASRKFEAGQATALDVNRWEAEVAQESVSIEQLEGALHVRQRQLAVLLGTSQPPKLHLRATATIPQPPATLLPADLLERRPDVQRQARALDAALARVGVAKHDIYPRVHLAWAGSRERLAAINGSASPMTVAGYGISISLPIFDGGRIRSNIAVQEARAQEAMAGYEQAMLVALADVETALTQWSTAEATLHEWRRAQEAGETAARRAARLYDAGLVDASAVLDAQRGLLRAQDGVRQAEGAQWAAAVGLRRVFAGAV